MTYGETDDTDAAPPHDAAAQASQSSHSCLARILLAPFQLVLVAVMVATVAAWLGTFSWVFELFTPWRFQYGIGAGICVAALLLRRASTGWTVAGIVVFIVHAWVIVPWYLPAERPVKPGAIAGPQLRILVSNVYTANPYRAALLTLIEREQPDIVALMEVDNAWVASLEPFLAGYPYHLLEPRSDNFGIALFSRVPLIDPRIVQIGPTPVPTILTRLDLTGQEHDSPTTLMLTHTLPPVRPRNFAERNAQLFAVGEALAERREAGDAVILLGDLNATMWSPFYTAMRDRTKLRNARRGFGIAGTWPADRPAWMRIPIDHALVSEQFAVAEFRVLEDIGSDHRPLLVTLHGTTAAGPQTPPKTSAKTPGVP